MVGLFCALGARRRGKAGPRVDPWGARTRSAPHVADPAPPRGAGAASQSCRARRNSRAAHRANDGNPGGAGGATPGASPFLRGLLGGVAGPGRTVLYPITAVCMRGLRWPRLAPRPAGRGGDERTPLVAPGTFLRRARRACSGAPTSPARERGRRADWPPDRRLACTLPVGHATCGSRDAGLSLCSLHSPASSALCLPSVSAGRGTR